MRILITGGAGYIGSHILLELLSEGHEVCVVDNFSNSSPEVLARLEHLAGTGFQQSKTDIRDTNSLNSLFRTFMPEIVLHLAGLKSVGESTASPLAYYEHNISGTINVLKAMDETGCRKILFSSSAMVYGPPLYLPYDEAHPCAPVNPYGRTKYFIEEILKDWHAATSHSSAAFLRYFNPIGAHPSGQIGENPKGRPNNLMPYITQVSIGKLPGISIFGNDYDTHDGTGLRDYIHVMDLARAHAMTVDYLEKHSVVEAVNIGTGKGVSVFDVIRAFEKASARSVPYNVTDRRPGDVACLVANPAKALSLLGWKAELDLEDMCRDAWNWQSQNPDGYA